MKTVKRELRVAFPDGTERTLATVRPAGLLSALTQLRSCAYDLANGGRHGSYPVDGSFNDAVEEGFSDNGMSWTALDGTTVRTVEIPSIPKSTNQKQ